MEKGTQEEFTSLTRYPWVKRERTINLDSNRDRPLTMAALVSLSCYQRLEKPHAALNLCHNVCHDCTTVLAFT